MSAKFKRLQALQALQAEDGHVDTYISESVTLLARIFVDVLDGKEPSARDVADLRAIAALELPVDAAEEPAEPPAA